MTCSKVEFLNVKLPNVFLVLAEGADLDGDDEINYIAYVQLVTRQIIKLRKVRLVFLLTFE